jgi:phage recombination protein Bet
MANIQGPLYPQNSNVTYVRDDDPTGTKPAMEIQQNQIRPTQQVVIKEANSKQELVISEETIEKFLSASQSKLLPEEKTMFTQIAKALNLNPFLKQIYVIAYNIKDGGRKLSIVVSYMEYIKRALRTKLVDGWHAEPLYDENGKLDGSKILILRKDWATPFEWTVRFSEFDKQNSIWKQQPSFQITKVAISQGFRLCFPEETADLPLSDAENELVMARENATILTEEDKPKKKEKKETTPVNPALVANIHKISDYYKEKGLLSKPEMYQELSALCGREIKSAKDLTEEETNLIIENLKD